MTTSNDFLAPLTLTIAKLASLRSSDFFSPPEDALLVELRKLEVVLFRTTLLDHNVHNTGIIALKDAVTYCRDTIIQFWEERPSDWRTKGVGRILIGILVRSWIWLGLRRCWWRAGRGLRGC